MAAPCFGHECMEREYRADVLSSSVKNKGANCPADAVIVTAIIKGWADDAFEDEHCDKDKCACNLPPWPATWTTIEANVTYTAAYVDLDCKADVTITYNWQCRERSAKCYRQAPKKGKG